MSDLITISGVRGYIDENGTAQLNRDDISKGLGFTQIKNGQVYVRRDRVNNYIEEMGFPHLVGKAFIPENVFYRLAMKAENETAQKFQSIVADEILPAIRKTGTYSISLQIPQTLPEALRAYANEVENHLKAKALLEEQKPKVLFADSVAGSEKSILINELAKILKQNGIDIGQNRLFKLLREQGYLCRQVGENYNLPTQRSMDLGVLEVKKSSVLTAKGDTLVTRTTKVTSKGQIYFVNHFLNADKLEVI